MLTFSKELCTHQHQSKIFENVCEATFNTNILQGFSFYFKTNAYKNSPELSHLEQFFPA